MFRTLFLLFIVLPIIEIAILMEIGALLGFWPTLAIIVITAWVGAKKVRQQGVVTMQSAQTKMAQGEMPSDDLIAGVMLLVAGVLLVTPGFVTDFFGLSLLFPVSRNWLIKQAKKHIKVNTVANGQAFHSGFHFQANQSQPYHHANQANDTVQSGKGRTIEGEFEQKE